jgi:hypothetical protein
MPKWKPSKPDRKRQKRRPLSTKARIPLPQKPDHPEIAIRPRPKISRLKKSSLGTLASRTITARACSTPRRAVEDATAEAVTIAADVPTVAAARSTGHREAVAMATARHRAAPS